MQEVLIYYTEAYKKDMDSNHWKEIGRIACEYDWLGVGSGGDFCVGIGKDGDVPKFCEEISKLEYVASIEIKKFGKPNSNWN